MRNNGSVVSACFASIATGCGGGILASLLLDTTPSDSWMDKVTRVVMAKKRCVLVPFLNNREMEHLLTMSLCYQAAIGFLPLPFLSPLDPVCVSSFSFTQLTAKLLCFIVFFLLDGVERMMGVVVVFSFCDSKRLFVPIPLTESYRKTKSE